MTDRHGAQDILFRVPFDHNETPVSSPSYVWRFSGGADKRVSMAASVDEDTYNLGKAKELINRMHDEYAHTHPGESGEKYKYHLGEVLRHLDEATKTRAVEKGTA